MIGNKIKTFSIGDYFITTRQLISRCEVGELNVRTLKEHPVLMSLWLFERDATLDFWVRDFD